MLASEQRDFFKYKRSYLEVKQEIFLKYFDAWCNLSLLRLQDNVNDTMLFVDLNTGGDVPTESITGIDVNNQLYKTILAKPALNQAIHPFFYNRSKDTLKALQEGATALAFYEELHQPPRAISGAEDKAALASLFASGCPSLLFMDPFENGYTKEMLQNALELGQTDVFMLLNPENIAKSVLGKKVSMPLAALFGEQLEVIKTYCKKEKDSFRRQEFILNSFISMLQKKGSFTLLFKINLPESAQPYCYILFASTDGQAYSIFKEVVLPYSIIKKDGVPEFEANGFIKPQFSLFEEPPIYTCENLLERVTKNASLYKYKSIEKIYTLDSCGTNYILQNYVAVFDAMRKAGKVDLLNAKTMQTISKPTPSSIIKYKTCTTAVAEESAK
ncbi:hypothetical protein [uncultured Pontibacter sp.]|uniref:hypothetical protein n=1 Tax=uncultured Pontibacter sp. TaxID=453356 RepID=UPI0026161E09|nr:hypothetical protein [uncultured Pontibacter sp.]